MIGKVETFDDDVRYILEKNRLTSLVPDHNLRMNSAAKNGSSPSTDKGETRNKFLATLTQEQKDQLLQIFKPDYEMFGYSYDYLLEGH